jgi:hypothetical protein
MITAMLNGLILAKHGKNLFREKTDKRGLLRF